MSELEWIARTGPRLEVCLNCLMTVILFLNPVSASPDGRLTIMLLAGRGQAVKRASSQMSILDRDILIFGALEATNGFNSDDAVHVWRAEILNHHGRQSHLE